MRAVSRKSLASLLVVASLSAPGVALASDPAVSVPIMAPISAPAEESATLAAFKVTADQAIATVKEYFAIPAELGEPNVSRSQAREYAAWSLRWQSPPKQAERISIEVEVDGITGEVRSYRRSETKLEQTSELNYSRSEAYKVAAEWLQKLAGDLTEQLRYVDNPAELGYYGGADATYTFRWNRMEQGYPVAGDGIAFAVDARTGEMTYYSRQWRPDFKVTLPAEVLEQEQADAAYFETLAKLFQLQYNEYHKPGTDESDWRLIYRPITGYPMVDMEGKLVDYNGKPLNLEKVTGFERVVASDKAYQAPSALLTEAQALAVAKAVSGRSDAPTDVRYNEYGEADAKRHEWHFSWFSPTELKEGEYNTDVTVDAKTGLVTNLGNWFPGGPRKEGQQPTVTQAEARAKAVAFIRTHRPDLAGNVLMAPALENERAEVTNWGVRFLPLKNDIVVTGRSIYVDVDAETGRIRYFSYYDEAMADAEFPAPKGLLEPARVAESFLKHVGLEATWVTFSENVMPMPIDSEAVAEAAKPETRLVYVPVEGFGFDAFDAKSGAPLDYQGRDLIEAAKRPADIEGHYAQREIELLWARGIFELKDGKFNPNQTITAAELARWLVLAKGMRPYVSYNFSMAFDGKGAGAAEFAAKLESNWANAYFGAALQSGIFLPEDFDLSTDPEAVVSRELFALWAVRAMGYGSIASMPNRIEMSFLDKEAIGAKYANAVAILEGLGAVKGGGNGLFAPKGSLTRGEAAKILFVVSSQVRR